MNLLSQSLYQQYVFLVEPCQIRDFAAVRSNPQRLARVDENEFDISRHPTTNTENTPIIQKFGVFFCLNFCLVPLIGTVMGYGSHLIRRPHGIYYFRYTPKGGKEVRISLRTNKVTIARRIAGLCLGVMWLYQNNGGQATAETTQKIINSALKRDGIDTSPTDPNTALAKLESVLKNKGIYESVAPVMAEMREKLKWVSSHLTDYPHDLEGMLEAYEDSFPIFEEEREAAGIAQIKAQAKALYNATPPVTKPTPTSPSSSANQLLFSDAVNKFIAERVDGGIWRPKTKKQHAASYDMFMELMGDQAVSSYKRTDISAYKDKLALIPVSCTKIFPGISFSEVIAKQHGCPTLSITTRNKRLVELSSLFEWCEKNGYCEKNPAKDMQIRTPKSKKDQEARKSWSQDDFNLLIKSLYKGNAVVWPHYYWLPLLGIYTGARLNELAQLDVDDVMDKDGILCLNIDGKVGGDGYYDDNGNVGKQLKNSNSKRIIPLHSHLIRIGFMEFVEQRRNSGDKKLWEGLNPSVRDGWGSAPSKWFARSCFPLINAGKIQSGLTFHGLRHTFRDLLAGQHGYLISEYMGHGADSITFSHYGGATDLSVMKDMIEHLRIDSSITDGLRWSDIKVTGRKGYRKHIKPTTTRTKRTKTANPTTAVE